MKTYKKKTLSVNSIIRQLNRATFKCTYLVKVSKFLKKCSSSAATCRTELNVKSMRFYTKKRREYPIPYKHENRLWKSSVVTLMF